MSLNQIRIVMAAVLLAVAHRALFGTFLPHELTLHQGFWLVVSGVIGLTLGDLCLLRCFVMIGPRLGMLIMTTAPIITAVAAWPVLDEALGWTAIVGIGVTLGGVVWVLADRRRPRAFPAQGAARALGILLGLCGATGQALGLVCAKLGMQAEVATTDAGAAGEALDPLSATLVRMIAGGLGIWLIGVAQGRAPAAIRAMKNSRAMLAALAGAVLGPFLGVWLSLIAVTYTEAGIAATMMAMPPIIMLPLARFVYGERVGWGAILGTVVAVVGVAILFLGGK
jgi:drug/metabolite transporter (DMT)-like permease